MHVCLIRNGNVFISDASDGDDLQKAPKFAAANFMERVYIRAFPQLIRLNSSVGRETNKVLCSGGRFPAQTTFYSVTIPITVLCVTSLSGRSDIFAGESLVGLSGPTVLYAQESPDPGHQKQSHFRDVYLDVTDIRTKRNNNQGLTCGGK
jgi:hypothetical protein